MKKYSVFLVSVTVILCWLPNGLADRLHHWVDSKGVTHLSKDPPPENGKLVEIMEYSSRTDEPVRTDPDEFPERPRKKNNGEYVESEPDTADQPASGPDPARTCYILANGEEVYVYAIEQDPMGGPQDRVVFQGYIPKDQRQLIISPMGEINFTYRRSVDDRSYGDNRADCANGNVISIP